MIPKLSMEALLDALKNHSIANTKYMALKVTIPGAPKCEVLINPIDNFEAKKEYVEKTYTEELHHKHAPLHVVDYYFGNSYNDIESHLAD